MIQEEGRGTKEDEEHTCSWRKYNLLDRILDSFISSCEICMYIYK